MVTNTRRAARHEGEPDVVELEPVFARPGEATSLPKEMARSYDTAPVVR